MFKANNAWDNISDDSEGDERDHQEEEVVQERLPIEVTEGLKQLLEYDCNLIKKHNKVCDCSAKYLFRPNYFFFSFSYLIDILVADS